MKVELARVHHLQELNIEYLNHLEMPNQLLIDKLVYQFDKYVRPPGTRSF